MSQYKCYRKATAKQIRIIKMAQKELDLDDNTYRALLRDRFGKDSCTRLTDNEAAKLIDQFIQWGFMLIGNRGKPNVPNRQAQIDKIGALLTIGKRPWSYADALAKNICKVDSLRFVQSDGLGKIISALVKQAKREKWDLK